MRLPRPRLRLRTFLIAVAVIGVGLGFQPLVRPILMAREIEATRTTGWILIAGCVTWIAALRVNAVLARRRRASRPTGRWALAGVAGVSLLAATLIVGSAGLIYVVITELLAVEFYGHATHTTPMEECYVGANPLPTMMGLFAAVAVASEIRRLFWLPAARPPVESDPPPPE